MEWPAELEREQISERIKIERRRGEETLRANAAERLASLERETAARKEAEAASQLKDEFLATASHELRTPLTSILGWSRLLRAGQLDPARAAKAVEIIERNAKAQVQLVEDLLDGSRIITGKLHLEIRPVDLTELTRSAIEVVRPAVAAQARSPSPALRDPTAR